MLVCRDRKLALNTLAQEGQVDVVLSDDGLQHYGMPRDVELIMTEGVRIEMELDASCFEVPQYPYPDEQALMESLFEADRAISSWPHGIRSHGAGGERVEREYCTPLAHGVAG